MNHVDDVTKAFDTIHEAMRAMQRQNLDLRKQVEQAKASKVIAEQERDDALRQLAQMKASRRVAA
jgi:hypothetical protein